jgi:hypothetical protein
LIELKPFSNVEKPVGFYCEQPSQVHLPLGHLAVANEGQQTADKTSPERASMRWSYGVLTKLTIKYWLFLSFTKTA